MDLLMNTCDECGIELEDDRLQLFPDCQREDDYRNLADDWYTDTAGGRYA